MNARLRTNESCVRFPHLVAVASQGTVYFKEVRCDLAISDYPARPFALLTWQPQEQTLPWLSKGVLSNATAKAKEALNMQFSDVRATRPVFAKAPTEIDIYHVAQHTLALLVIKPLCAAAQSVSQEG